MENIEEKRVDIISKWEEKSRDFIDAFLLLFGREGRLVGIGEKAFYLFIILYFILFLIGIAITFGYTAKKCANGLICLMR